MVAILLFVGTCTIGQTAAVEDTSIKFAITSFGMPDGDKTTMEIGKQGGSISSSDGIVTLVFPEGALLKSTNISIQPITNMAPNGNGKAYRMEPSGIVFRKHAAVIFNYANEEKEDNIQALMGIGMQDDKGKWYKLNKIVTDTVAKTITGSIRHFSVYVNYSEAKIFPANAKVKVNGSIRLQIVGAFNDETDNSVETIPLRVEYPTMKWSVNGIEKGNSEVGLISTSNSGSAIFKAPAQIPVQNPVAITVYPTRASAFITRYQHFKMAGNILIYDNAYEVNMVYKQDAGQATISDYGSFAVAIEGDKATILRIVNNNCLHNHDVPDCIVTLINPGMNHGNIHIKGINKITLLPATLPNYATVEISFVASPIVYSTFRFSCRDQNGKWFTAQTNAATAMVAASPAQPLFIKFLAKEGEQVIQDIKLPGGYYKVTVKKIKEEE